MSKDQEAQSRSRLTLDLSAKMTAALNAYADEHDISKADALRTALEFLMAANDATKNGLKVGAWGNDDGHRVEREFVSLAR